MRALFRDAALLSVCVIVVLAQPAPAAAAKPKRLTCLDKSGMNYVFKRKPRSCTVFGPGGASAGGVRLARLTWTGWGRRTARATGLECGFQQGCQRIKVRVRAYRLRTCGSRRVYTRLRATSKFGTTTAHPARCPRPAY